MPSTFSRSSGTPARMSRRLSFGILGFKVHGMVFHSSVFKMVLFRVLTAAMIYPVSRHQRLVLQNTHRINPAIDEELVTRTFDMAFWTSCLENRQLAFCMTSPTPCLEGEVHVRTEEDFE